MAPEGEERFWDEFVRQWLGRLASTLGPGYCVDESANFHLLSSLPGWRRADTMKFLEGARKTVLRVLGDRIKPRGTVGKHVVLCFAREIEYYRYVSHFGTEGESAGSGGMFLRGGYMHIATFEQPLTTLEHVLIHELTHNLTSHLPHPLWLCEALAMFFEYDVAGGRPMRSAVDLQEEHKRSWTCETIQEFWKGSSFSSVEGQAISYSLADTLFRLIRSDVRPQPDTFQRFVLAADWNDAGHAAARDYLGVGLDEIAGIFLGTGEWKPKPETWRKKEDGKAIPEASVTPDENGFIWPEGLEPEPESK